MDDLKNKASGSMDNAEGKGKEAFGQATDDDKTKREGQVDQAKGDAKDAAGDAKNKADDTLDKLKK